MITIFMERMRYFKMNREKEITNNYSHIPEAEILDYWEEDSESVIYDNWDRIKSWLKNIIKKIWRFSVF